MTSFSSIFNSLPPKIRVRFGGLQAYAKSVVEADEERPSKERRTSAAEMQRIQILFQLVLLDRFLQRGTEVAKATVKELEAAGLGGFSVGVSVFEGENEAVMRGANLSDRLRTAIPQVRQIATRFSHDSASQLALSIRDLIRNG